MLPKLTVEKIQKDQPDLYNEIFNAGKDSVKVEDLQAKITELQSKLTSTETENQKLKDHVLIRQKAAQLSVPSKGEELVAAGTSVTDALMQLIDHASKEGPEENVLKGVFTKTAPEAAGQGNSGTEVVKTQQQAKDAVLKVNPNLKGRDLIRAARKQFPKVFNIYGQQDAGEEE